MRTKDFVISYLNLNRVVIVSGSKQIPANPDLGSLKLKSNGSGIHFILYVDGRVWLVKLFCIMSFNSSDRKKVYGKYLHGTFLSLLYMGQSIFHCTVVDTEYNCHKDPLPIEM